MGQIILFSRTSTTSQDVEQQTESLVNEAVRLGYPVEKQIIVEYQESGIKLNIETRQGIRKLKEVIENNPDIDCMICWELTRIARRADVIYNIRDFLVEHKIRWIICKPSYMELIDKEGKQTQVSSLMLGIFTSFAESEMVIKKERFARARAEMKKQGKKSTGATIFGYIKNKDKKMELHPVNAQIVYEVYEHYVNVEDASLYSTYMWLSGKYPDKFPVMEYKKAQRRLKHFFEVSAYWEGNWCYPPIVTREMHDKVEEKFKKARCMPRYECKHNWLGRGKVYCKHCGKMMTPVAGEVNAYNCVTDKKHNMTINVDAVEWLIWEEAKVVYNIKALMDNSQTIIMTNNSINEKTNLIKQYDIKINELNIRQEKLLKIYLKGSIDESLFEEQNTIILDEIRSFEDKKNKTNAEIIELNGLLKNNEMTEIKPINYDDVENFETKLDIVRQVIDKIWIEKIENKVYELEFTYRGVVVPQKGHYRYISKNQFKRIWRINEDETEDLIYEQGKVWNQKN